MNTVMAYVYFYTYIYKHIRKFQGLQLTLILIRNVPSLMLVHLINVVHLFLQKLCIKTGCTRRTCSQDNFVPSTPVVLPTSCDKS